MGQRQGFGSPLLSLCPPQFRSATPAEAPTVPESHLGGLQPSWDMLWACWTGPRPRPSVILSQARVLTGAEGWGPELRDGRDGGSWSVH